MDVMQEYMRDLAALAPTLEGLVRQNDRNVFYDLFSGSLVWPDELPKRSRLSLDCLRFVLKHRTGLITGEPMPVFEPFWNEAQARFPNWIGFSDDRVAYSPVLRDFYLAEQAAALTDE